MKKTIIAIAVLYGIAALGTPYFVGDQIEKNTRQFFTGEQQQKLAAQGIDLSLKQYNKGYFSSTADLHLTVTAPTGEILYDGDFNADIKHAPLSLSGINAANIHVTGANQPSGAIGDHVPQDFISATASKGVFSLMKGDRSVNIDLDLAAVNTDIDGANFAFKGLNANIVTPTSNTAYPSFALDFHGLNGSETTKQFDLTIQPFKLDSQIADDGTTFAITLDKLDIDVKDGYPQQRATIKLNDFVTRAGSLTEAENYAPYVARFGYRFDSLEFSVIKDDEAGSINIKNGDFLIGFIPDSENYAFNLMLKGQPTFSGAAATDVPIQPDNIDVNLHIEPFTHDYLAQNLQTTFATAQADPQNASTILGQGLGRIIAENAMAQDITATINATIDGKSGKLFSAEGEVHEYLKQDSDIMAMMFDPTKVTQYFRGSKLNLFASEAFLRESGLKRELRNSGLPQAELSDDDGNLKLDLNISDNQVLINGQPAPF